MADRLPEDDIQRRLERDLPGWRLEDGFIVRRYETGDWRRTTLLAGALQYYAEAAGHHPDLELGYPSLTVRFRTHDADGITESDLELATKIEETASWRPSAGSSLPGPAGEWIE